jgi:hypothetical protein
MSAPATNSPDDLVRLDILRAYKRHFGRHGDVNMSPFTDGRVVRYHSDVQAVDVPEIHEEVRNALCDIVRGIHQGQPSQVVILAGNPGMGKSHLINHFRNPQCAQELDYILVCNSNHWKVQEFEECLLDWVLEALVRPSPNKPHLLLEKIQDVAFQALAQILAQPGYVRQFRPKGASTLLHRLAAALGGGDQDRLRQMAAQRDPNVFGLLDFPKFAGYVCNLFLPEREGGNPFHRYVLRVLLQYLFEDDREVVLHWLRRKVVPDRFLAKKLRAEDRIDRTYKVIDTLRILITLFTPEVCRNLTSRDGKPSRDKVFFFAFDQMEGRQELFEDKADWFRFFAQLSELYNTLPNVFILFTMTLGLRNELYEKMEAQFKSRIRRDRKFTLHEIPDDEMLTLYRQRVRTWLGDGQKELREKSESPAYRYLPFTQEEVLSFSRKRTLREALQAFDAVFCKRMVEDVTTEDDPFYDYLVSRNEVRREEEGADEFKYTEDHLDRVKQLFSTAGQALATAFSLGFSGVLDKATDEGLAGLRLEFLDPADGTRWVRVFLVRLPSHYKKWVEGCVRLLYKLQTERNFLWLVRPERIEASLGKLKPPQTVARKLSMADHTTVCALLRLLDQKDRYSDAVWQSKGEKILAQELNPTYLGAMLQQVQQAMKNLQSAPAPAGVAPANQP